jgi:hypothetical protein
MRPSDLEIFAAINTNCYIEIVLDDGTIEVGKNFSRSIFDIDGDLNLWEIKPDNSVWVTIGGYNVKEIRRM